MTTDPPSLATLRDAPSQSPDGEYQEFHDVKGVKGIWETGVKLTSGSTKRRWSAGPGS